MGCTVLWPISSQHDIVVVGSGSYPCMWTRYKLCFMPFASSNCTVKIAIQRCQNRILTVRCPNALNGFLVSSVLYRLEVYLYC